MKVGIKKTVDVDVKTVKIHLKVRDEGIYDFLDQDGESVLEMEGEYVPNDIIPGEYGDYIELHIDLETGKILNWYDAKSVERGLKELFENEDD